jgi:hypothetical protein
VQLSKYHLSHRRGLIPHIGSVAKSVNIIAANWPLHLETEPE